MNSKPPLSANQLLAEIDDLQRTRKSWVQPESPEAADWMGKAQAVIHAWDGTQSIFFDGAVGQANSGNWNIAKPALQTIASTLARARHDLVIRTSKTGSRAIDKGDVFDYFDEVRKIVERAQKDLFFVDAYLSVDFVSRYLPCVARGTVVRMLGRDKMTVLVPAVEMMRQQSGIEIQVRYAEGFHDRWLFVDGSECFHSGSSFGEGAKKAPTTLISLLDGPSVVINTYEALWASASPR